MKTSVEISEPLARRVRAVMRTKRVTLRSLIEEGLERVIEEREPSKKYRLKDCSYGSGGLANGLSFADWNAISDLAYTGRGT